MAVIQERVAVLEEKTDSINQRLMFLERSEKCQAGSCLYLKEKEEKEKSDVKRMNRFSARAARLSPVGTFLLIALAVLGLLLEILILK